MSAGAASGASQINSLEAPAEHAFTKEFERYFNLPNMSLAYLGNVVFDDRRDVISRFGTVSAVKKQMAWKIIPNNRANPIRFICCCSSAGTIRARNGSTPAILINRRARRPVWGRDFTRALSVLPGSKKIHSHSDH